MRLASALALGVLALSGCAVSRPANPLEVYRQAVLARTETDPLSDAVASRMGTRNQRVNDLVFLVDDSYATYETDLYAQNGVWETIADMLVLGASAGATATGSVGLKTALSAATAAITGTRVSIEKNIFAEQSRLAIVAKMRAQRAVVLERIELGLRRPVREYSLSEAMIDVEAYDRAGSVLSALQGLTAGAVESLATAQEKLSETRKAAPAAEE